MDKEDFALHVASKNLLSPEEASLLPHGRFGLRTRKYFISGRISRGGGPYSAKPVTQFQFINPFVDEHLCLTLDSPQGSLRLKEIGFPKEIFGIRDATDTSGNVTWPAPCGHHHYFHYPCKVEITLASTRATWKDVSGVETLRRKEDDGSYWVPCKVMLDTDPNVPYEFTFEFKGSSVCDGGNSQCTYTGLEHVLQRVTNFSQFPLILNKYGGGGPLDPVIKVRLERQEEGPNTYYHDPNHMPITSGFVQHFVFDLGEYDDVGSQPSPHTRL